jgi:type I restriction enzyme S subunit
VTKLHSGWITTPIATFTIDCDQRTPEETEEFKYIDIGSINRETKHIETQQKMVKKNRAFGEVLRIVGKLCMEIAHV